MSLVSRYQRFLSSPSAESLAENAALSYVPTLTTLHDSAAILKHLTAQGRQLKKKSEKILSAIASKDALCLDIETTIEFISTGGAYLPGLDDNFLADRVVTFPMIHIIQFNAESRIQNIRLHWDQGSLLQQIEVIGARGRNWPLRPGIDQAKLIASTSSFTTEQESEPSSRRSTASDARTTSRPQSKGAASAMKDPHESLSLFAPREEQEETPQATTKIAPRMSAKPPPRDLSELFYDGDDAQPETPSNRGNARGGSNKHYHPIRLFEGEEDTASPPESVERSSIKAHPSNYNHFEFGNGEDATTPTKAAPPISVKSVSKKYNHFEFGDGEEATTPKQQTEMSMARSAKHNSQWNFEDFNTPAKPQHVPTRVHKQDVRHFGWSDDELEDSPIKRPMKYQERPDARPHFDFVDDGTPEEEKKKRPTSKAGKAHNSGLGLYSDHVTGAGDVDEEAEWASKQPRERSTTNNENRQKTFGAHWDMTDSNPDTAGAKPSQQNGKNLSESNKRVLKGLDSSWDMYDESPNAAADAKKENVPTKKPQQARGDGMGGRKGTSRTWGFGDDSDDESNAPVQTKPRRAQQSQSDEKSWWDF